MSKARISPAPRYTLAKLSPPFSSENSLLQKHAKGDQLANPTVNENPTPNNTGASRNAEPTSVTSVFRLPHLRPDDTQSEFLVRELSVLRLNEIHKYLWWAGRPRNIRSLHRQKIMQREIIITEQTDLHLVWHEFRMFVKPLPTFLLDHDFFKKNICSSEISKKEESTLHASACGLLFSYTQLIRHESDLEMAKDARLLPPSVEWERWCAFASEVCRKVQPDQLNRRYRYGELRLSRLNMIYRFALWKRGYHIGYNRYSSFFQRNFSWLVLVFAYLSILLGAMQVGLGTKQGGDMRFQKISYGFAVFSLVAISTIVVLIVLLFFILFFYYLITTLIYGHEERKKRRAMSWKTEV